MADIGTLTPEQMLQQQQNLRNQKMSEMLLQKGIEQPQGQMISGHYVAPSIFQNLAGLANTYMGQRGLEKADQAQIDLAKAIRAQHTDELNQFNQLLPTKPMEAYSFAAQAYNPKLQEIGLKKMIPQEFDLPEGARRIQVMPDGTVKEIATGGEKTAPDVRTAAQMLGIRGNPETWNPQQTAAVNAQVMNLKRASATNVSLSAGNKFASGFGEKASARADALYDAAENAPQQIENAKRTIELVNSGALTGPTADVALMAAKIFNVAGANNQDTITKTEQLFSNRGKAMLGSVKSSGLAGSQGLTEGERKFLTQAEGGTITLNAETLKAMAGLEIKLAVQAQKRWNEKASKMDPEILRATGSGPVEVYTGIGTIDASNPLLAPKR
jgi:hypothetical protein